MSRAIPQAVAPGGIACSPQAPVRPEPRSSHPNALVSLVAALASLGGGLSPWAVPPALLLGALGLFHAAPARAQITLVSNTGQMADEVTGTTTQVNAQGFTTGSNATGYTLSSIEAVFGSAANAAQRVTIRAELWSATSGGAPSSKLASLTVPSTVSAGTVAFTAPANTTLTANTTYHFVLYTVGSYNARLSSTDSTNEDSGGQTGWSIANDSYSIAADQPGGGSWTSGFFESLRIGVKGTVNPPAAPTNLVVTPDTAKLDLSWTAPSGTLTGYDVHYTSATVDNVANGATVQAVSAAAGWLAVSRGTENDPPTASQSITSLTNDTAYRVRIRATNSNGSSSWVFGTGTPKAKTWKFQPTEYFLDPDGGTNVQIALSVPAPDGGLTFTLTRQLGTAVPTGLCDDASQTKATAEDVGSSPPTSLTVQAGEMTSGLARFNAADNGDDTAGTQSTAGTRECFAVSASITADGWMPATGGSAAELTIETRQPTIVFGSARFISTLPDYAATVSEGAGTASVPVTVDYLPASSMTFAVEVVTGQNDGTATEYVDVQNPGDCRIATKSVTFGPSDTSKTKNLSVAITDDSAVESNETIVLQLATGNNHAVPTTGGRATLTIEDNDDPPTTRPRSLTAAAGHQKLDLTWEAPSTGTASGYDVHYTSAPTSGSGAVANDAAVQTGQTATAADGWVAVDRTGAALSQEITGLVNDREYRVRVRGTSGGGDGPWEQVKGTPRRTLSFVGNSEVAVEGENEAEEIYVELSEAAAVATTVNIVVSGGTAVEGEDYRLNSKTLTIPAGQTRTTLLFTALTDFVEEGEEEVRLDLSAPDGAPYVLGDSSQMEVVVLDAAAPGAPENLAVVSGDGKLELSWTPVPGDPEGYDVEYRQLGASTWTDAGHTGTDPSQTITGLTNGRGYQVRVRWSDGAATGSWGTGSGIPTVQTLRLSVDGQLAEGGEDVTLTATLGQAAAEARTIWITASGTATGGTSSINVDWSASPSQIGDGVLQIPLSIAQGQRTATATIKVVDDEDVDAGETVVLEGRADGAAVGHTTPRNVDLVAPLVSNTLTLTIEDNEEGPPGLTTALTVTTGDGKLALSWTAPSDNGGSVVTGYHVHYTSAAAGTVADDGAVQTGASPSPANGWVAVDRSGTAVSQEITGLSNGTVYRVRVRARNSNGDGAWTHGKGTPLAGAQPPAPTGTTVWSATLTVKDTLAGLGLSFGCSNSSGAGVECSLTSVLTEDQFTYDGVTYDVRIIENTPEDGVLKITLNKNAPSAFAPFTLEVNGNSVGRPSVGGARMDWESAGLSWSEGDTVSLRLVEGPPAPPSAPTVTVTASLSAALSSDVRIPVTISTSSPNTAEPEEVGTLTAITIASGATSGTGTIATNQDDDTEDETFTVALDTANLPSEVTAGSPSSVLIRISEGGGGGGGGGAPDLTVATPLVVSIRGGEAITEGGEARFTLSATPAPATGTSLSVRGERQSDG